jgi:hypothetical protein
MNYKLNSYLSILAIACAVAVPLLSATARELPVQASLTAPADYDYFFRPIDNPSPAPDFWRLGDWDGTISPNGSNDLRFTRTADGVFYNYSITTNNSTHSFLPDGLEIIMTFNRSNSSWTQVSGTSLYNPTDYNKIGSDGSINATNKFYFKFDNQTNKDYLINFDNSSSSNVSGQRISYNGNVLVFAYGQTEFQPVSLPSYSYIEIYVINSSLSKYFDAWYLTDLGDSAAYDAGYDLGEADGYEDGLANNPNILINAAESLIGMFVNFTFILFSLELFGVSILTVVGVLFGIVAIVWILKTIRG